MTNNEEKSISELLTTLNQSIEDMRNTKVEEIKTPSSFEIMVKGIAGTDGLNALFSPKIDDIIFGLFNKIQMGDFSYILGNQENLKKIIESIFGKGAFQGKIGTEILNSIQASMNSEKYIFAKSIIPGIIGKARVIHKKIKLVFNNLEKNGKKFSKDSEEYKKYQDSIYALKQFLKFVILIYKNRSIVNRKVYYGLNNIVHENTDYYIDETCWNWGDL